MVRTLTCERFQIVGFYWTFLKLRNWKTLLQNVEEEDNNKKVKNKGPVTVPTSADIDYQEWHHVYKPKTNCFHDSIGLYYVNSYSQKRF